MNKSQKKIIIVIVILLIFTSIFAVYLSLTSNNKSEEPIGSSDKIVINKKIVVLENETEYFNIQATINNYYELLAKKNNQKIYNILEENYKLENNISENNVTDIIYSKYEAVSYTATKIYYNENSDVTYYFITGYLFNQTMMEDDYSYENNVSYLLIEKNNKYVIKPLGNITNLKNYANNYELKDLEINSNTSIENTNITEKNKIVLYINEFLNLLFLDTQKAYDMLDDDTKNKYLGYEDFYNQIESIYQNISTNIFSYTSDNTNNYNLYKIQDRNQRTITITEYRTMEYKIGY